ncbi:putative AhpC/TSA family protein [Blattamonas nauphoetae]|uniref:AhpC/TSA family protein n=1 Tax=Blattamonas nauphoetae TaxID=2049346 RepID=A0ABQ9WWV7_9EUKA|nr:putative AhpC/TSA family protein [Blattamonas nauphoetae]
MLIILLSELICLSALRVGEKSPDFTLVNQDGRKVRFKNQLGDGPVVIFIFHKTTYRRDKRMLKAFRFMQPFYNGKKATIFGVSHVSTAKLAKAKKKYRLKYDLLSDPDYSLKDIWGLKRRGLHNVARTTLVFDSSGILTYTYKSESWAKTHARKGLSGAGKAAKKKKMKYAEEDEEMDGLMGVFEDAEHETWDADVDITEDDRRDTVRMLAGLEKKKQQKTR